MSTNARRVALILALVFAVAVCAEHMGAQGSQRSPISALHVQGGVHLLTGAGVNVVVQAGPLGVVVVDPGPKEQGENVLAAIRALTDKPIRQVINTHAHPDHVGANELLASSGAAIGSRTVAVVGSGQLGRAEIIAHELVLNRLSSPAGSDGTAAIGGWPTATFSSNEKTFYTNNEGIQIIHQPAAHTDGDSLVFFRRSDVIAAGDVYSTISFPVIDEEHGGTITGVLAGLNQLLALVIPGEKIEGGTMVVPGHGRISDEADLVEYRDMVTIIRDRVDEMIKRGMTLQQIKTARPTLEYDPLYGKAPGWNTDQFVEAVYRGLRGDNGTRTP